MPTTPKADWDTWVDKNPLRSWRHKNKVTILRAASSLDVTVTTIQQWERGAVTPTDENMDRIATITGDESTASKWSRWRSRRPKDPSTP